MNDAQATVSNLLERVNILGEQLDIILFQLPPRWHCNPQRLRDCLAALDPEYQYAFEFRDRTWHNSQVYGILAEHGIAFCIYDLGGYLSPKEVTADFVYLRLHGPHFGVGFVNLFKRLIRTDRANFQHMMTLWCHSGFPRFHRGTGEKNPGLLKVIFDWLKVFEGKLLIFWNRTKKSVLNYRQNQKCRI
ncbi:MAG: DUF72 domain-containing protein [Coleofasciculus sp. E2-BRE-01]